MTEPTVAFGQPQRSLDVSQVLKEGRALNESEEVVVVRFRVACAAPESVAIGKDVGEDRWLLSSENAPYDGHPLAFRVSISTKALDELKKNGVEDIAKHFVGKILEVEGPVHTIWTQRQFVDDQLMDEVQSVLRSDVLAYGITVYNLAQIREAMSDTSPAIDGSKALDRENIRSVIEVYVAAALRGDHTTAASVAIVQGKPADPNQIEPQIQAIARSLNLKQFAMRSIYLNDWEHSTGALAISESVTHAEKQGNGERTGFVMLELTKIEDNWFVIGVDFRTKEAANEILTQFLEANPKSIDLPPLTPNSLPQRNSVDGVPKVVPENADKSLRFDADEASPIAQPRHRKNTPAEADYDSNSEPVPEQSRSAGQAIPLKLAPVISDVRIDEKTAIVSGMGGDDLDCVLRIGKSRKNEQLEWTTPVNGQFCATLTPSDQLKSDNGKWIEGIVFTIQNENVLGTSNIGMSEGDPVPAGEVRFRQPSAMGRADTFWTFADILCEDGTEIPKYGAIHLCMNDNFGPDRVVFGGDWPVCLLGGSYKDWVTTLRQIISSRPVAD
jgi:hypothetical protein